MQKENYFPERWRSSTQHEGDFNMISVVFLSNWRKKNTSSWISTKDILSNIHDFIPLENEVHPPRSHRFKEGHLLRSEFRMFFCYREATVSLVATRMGDVHNLLTMQHQPIPRFFCESPCNSPKPWCDRILNEEDLARQRSKMWSMSWKAAAMCEFFVMRVKGHHPKNATYPGNTQGRLFSGSIPQMPRNCSALFWYFFPQHGKELVAGLFVGAREFQVPSMVVSNVSQK